MDEPLQKLEERIPARAISAIRAAAESSDETVGQFIDKLCTRAGLYDPKASAPKRTGQANFAELSVPREINHDPTCDCLVCAD